MIQGLRKKFILTNMALVSVVLVFVLSIQVFTAWKQSADQVTHALVQSMEFLRNGRKEEFRFDPLQEPRPRDAIGGPAGRGEFLSVPAFAVELDSAGKVTRVECPPGMAVTPEEAQIQADRILERGGERGRYRDNALQVSYLYREEGGRRLLSIAQDGVIAETVRRQLLVSLAILAAALVAFYFISRYLARRSLEPVERAWEQQRQFVADASHELKTPITVILANSDIVRAHPAETVERQEKWLGYIRDEAERMKALVEDLLFLAKSDAARLPTGQSSVQLDQVVTGALLPFESVAFEAGVTLTDHLTEGITVQGDEGQLHRLVVILLDNAVKYAGSGGSVTVLLERMGDQPRLTVHNSGPAIPPEHLGHLFERFYRSNAARDRDHRTNSGGYGLGLAIARSIVERHGGTIGVTSAEEVGTTFTVVFPRNGRKK